VGTHQRGRDRGDAAVSAPLKFPEIESEGFNARKLGFCPWHNPYNPGCRAYEAWERGWDRANNGEKK